MSISLLLKKMCTDLNLRLLLNYQIFLYKMEIKS